MPIHKCECGTIVPPEDRAPCPKCGYTGRIIEADSFDAATSLMNANLRGKAKSGGKGKPIYEWFGGGQWSVRFQKFMHKIRIIDRRNGLYLEEVKDPDTGETVHHCAEPLSEHQKHGSDKKP